MNKTPVTKVEEFFYGSCKQKYTCYGEIFDKSEIDTVRWDEHKSFNTAVRWEKIIQTKNKTICLLQHKGKVFKGVAKCCPNDSFDEVTGKKIAYLRAKINAYEAEIKELTK